jgi:hypothetical protein
MSRAPFYRPEPEISFISQNNFETIDDSREKSNKIELPKIREMNSLLKMKYNNKKELANISIGESKSPPFITDVDRYPKAV